MGEMSAERQERRERAEAGRADAARERAIRETPKYAGRIASIDRVLGIFGIIYTGALAVLFVLAASAAAAIGGSEAVAGALGIGRPDSAVVGGRTVFGPSAGRQASPAWSEWTSP